MTPDISLLYPSTYQRQPTSAETLETHLSAAMQWLTRAHDATGDGGVSAWYSLLTGWAPSYIETTGYIISTFLEYAKFSGDPAYAQRAVSMADFLLAEQHPSGGYRRHSRAVAQESEPIVFNTGQDLIGLSDVFSYTGEKKYLQSCSKAADFLLSIQEPDGSWLQFTYGNSKHAYHTRVAWGLLKVAECCEKAGTQERAQRYKKAAINHLDWALLQQTSSGWFQKAELPPPHSSIPFTHTISYVIEGFLWSSILINNTKYCMAATRAALPIARIYLQTNFLPATLDSQWQSSDNYTCLTGNAQLSLVWLKLYELTRENDFLHAARKMNSFLSSIQKTQSKNTNITGAIPGSWPIWGDLSTNSGYCRFAYPNWAAKFFADAALAELRLTQT